MPDKLFQVRFPQQNLYMRVDDPLVTKADAIKVFTQTVTDFIRENTEEHDLSHEQAVVSQTAEEQG